MASHKIDAYGNEGGIIIPGDRDVRLQKCAQDMPGQRRWVADKLTFQGSSYNWRHVHDLFQGEEWTPAAKLRYEGAVRKADRETLVKLRKKAELPPPEALHFPYKSSPPMEHQKRGWWISKEELAFAYLMEPGTGKTFLTIQVAVYLWSIGEIDSVFVIAPNGVHVQWIEQQIPLHCPDIARSQISPPLYTQMYAKDEQEYKRVLKSKDGLAWFALNCEALPFPGGYKKVEEVLSNRRCLLVVDESTKFKNPSATRTRALMKLRKLVKYVRILSGTPITNGVEDLYSQLMFLSPDILPVGSYTSFINRYCITGGYQGSSVIGYRNLEELQERLDPYSFRVLKKDCLDLPEKIYLEQIVTPTKEQLRVYRQMRDELLFEFRDGEAVTTMSATAAMMKLQQITSGFLLDGEGNEVWTVENNPKTALMLELLEEYAPQQFIVWCRFRKDVEVVKAALMKADITFCEYHGGIDTQQREIAVQDLWSGKARGLIGTSAAAIGLNLQPATLHIYFSNTFDAEVRWQSEDRSHRQGQTQTVVYADLVMKGTIDSRIIKSLKDKKNVAAGTLDDFKFMVEERLEAAA